MKSSKKLLEQRGYIDETIINHYKEKSLNELINLLCSKNSQERSVSAYHLGKKKCHTAINDLCDAFKKEKKLYSKIAQSNALAEIGVKSLPNLIKLLGKIGSNQYKVLPDKKFQKKNYPLPRDIAARTIIKIGRPALEELENTLFTGSNSQISEAVDAIGYIAYYEKDYRSYPVILDCLEKYIDDQIIYWKLIRALSAYPFEKSVNILNSVIEKTEIPAVRQEAVRSLSVIMKKL